MIENKKNIIILAVVIAVVLAIVIGGYFISSGKDEPLPVTQAKVPDAPIATIEKVENIAKVEDIMTEKELKEQELVDYALSFLEKENDKKLDSSGFIQHVFKHTYGIDLPRTTKEIRTSGAEISSTEVKLGDLIFFDPASDMGSVVGIYIGNNQFIYSSSSAGKVKIRDLKRDGYYVQRFESARKVK